MTGFDSSRPSADDTSGEKQVDKGNNRIVVVDVVDVVVEAEVVEPTEVVDQKELVRLEREDPRLLVTCDKEELWKL